MTTEEAIIVLFGHVKAINQKLTLIISLLEQEPNDGKPNDGKAETKTKEGD